MPPAPLAYPSQPQAIGGGDPFAALPPAVECSPARDRRAGGSYFPLSGLRQRRADNPYVTRDRGSIAVDLVNDKQQRFRIHISASTPAMVRRFVRTSTACYEAFPLTAQPAPMVEPVQFDALLVRAAASVTGRSATELAAARDQLRASGAPAALDDVLAGSGSGVDPAAVVAQAATEAKAALDAKVAAGELTATEVAAIDVPATLTALAALPDATFLYADADVPPGLAQLSSRMRSDKRGVVVIAAEAVSRLPAAQNMVWFAFDPTHDIATGRTHNYVGQCRSSASVSIYSWKGGQTLRFWRMSPYHFVGQSTTSAARPNSGTLAHSSAPSRRGYDTSVAARGGSGRYSIYGAAVWNLGSGRGC